jgi:hypothetical protein
MHDQNEYYKDLRKRQQEHLASIQNQKPWKPCAHDQCQNCVGTGIGRFGGACIHSLVCDCPKCKPASLCA